ncbi:S-adenosylmethionine-binding protein [Thermaerobacter sp. FW80]|uniref:MT-A70 family methyltransferase n=1 Tax=Thermaerobacter sp. FW80 TaxID=2546351 RepID=UPI001074B58F|nr:MT-A70 family methyltransferase [Thermaerobacter sp. FW80]QBS36913.1 S-adenosylmethionine-binding protein [Thermaerobacter sp. FW80]
MSDPRNRDSQEPVYRQSIRPAHEFFLENRPLKSVGEELLERFGGQKFGTILADPPWRFSNRTGKVAPEHRRLSRYHTMDLQEILELPIAQLALPQSHLYLWVPNALLAEGLEVMRRWGFTYKTNIIWYKVRKDGGPDRRGVGFYFRNVTEMVLFGVRGGLRTFKPGRRQENIIVARKREHSRKPDELYDIIEACSPGPYLELFARTERPGWYQFGDELGRYQPPDYPAYTRRSGDERQQIALPLVRDRRGCKDREGKDSWVRY